MDDADLRPVTGIGPWRGAVTGALLDFDVECSHPDRFTGSIGRRVLGETALVAMTSRPHRAVREVAHLDADAPAEYLLSLQLEGRAEFRADGRRTSVGPGDLVFYDSTRPVRITSGEGYRSLCFRFPRDRVGAPERTGELTATTLGAAHGIGPAVAGLLRGLQEGLARPGPRDAADDRSRPARDPFLAAARQATELARTLLDDELARRGLLATADPHAALRDRVDRHVEAHLGEPDLSPRTIAAALFVSVRHLHAVLADDGRTVGGTVRARRLERCLADLADPAEAATPVSAIATRWGFTSATRFGQLVKQATGSTPVAFRRAMLAGS